MRRNSNWRLILTMALTCLGSELIAQETVFSTPSGRSTLTWYGQLTPAISSFNDGGATTTTLTDNASSNSRIGFNMDIDYAEQGKLRLRFETALGFRQSSGVSQLFQPQGWNYEIENLRKLELIWTAHYGVISVGQGSMTSDGAATVSFSGVGLTNGVTISDPVGSFFFRQTDGTLSGVAVKDVFSDLDGSRRARFRYDSPSFSGFSVGAAAGRNVLTSGDDDNYYDAALRYASEFGNAKFEAALAYAYRNRKGAEDRQDTVGSASVILKNGLNFSLASGQRRKGGDGRYYYLKTGWIGNFWSVGSSAFSIDYNRSQDFNGTSDRATAVGIAYTQNFDRQGLEGYLGYRRYSLNDNAASYQNASSFLFGSRWRF